MTPDKNKDIGNLKVAAVGGIVWFTSKQERGRDVEVPGPPLKGHDDEYSLYRDHILGIPTIFRIQNEYKGKKTIQTLKQKHCYSYDIIDYLL